MASAKHTERRRYTRIGFDANVTLVQGNEEYDAHIVDLSLNGILVETPANYQIDTQQPAVISMVLADDTEIRMHVTLVHNNAELLGFHCDSIDLDSIGHLRRLIELNINQPHAAERVLKELVSEEALQNQ